jgi:hypothetical protein
MDVDTKAPKRTVNQKNVGTGKFYLQPTPEKGVRARIEFPEKLSYMTGVSFVMTVLSGTVGSSFITLRKPARIPENKRNKATMYEVKTQIETTQVEFYMQEGSPLLASLRKALRAEYVGSTDVEFVHLPDEGTVRVVTPRRFKAYEPKKKSSEIVVEVPVQESQGELPLTVEVTPPAPEPVAEVAASTGSRSATMSDESAEVVAWVAQECRNAGVNKQVAILQAIRIFDREYSA